MEKVIGRASNVSQVNPGEIVWANADLVLLHDSSAARVVPIFEKEFGGSVWEASKIVIVFDHFSPPSDASRAAAQRKIRKFARQQGIRRVHDVGDGACHTILRDRYACPGMLIVGSDSHMSHSGVMGCVAIPIGHTECATVLKTGQLWLRVPELYKLSVVGNLPIGVMAKDIFLNFCRKLTTSGAIYKAIEFGGNAVLNLPIDQRAVLTGMVVEIGAKTAYIEPDEKVIVKCETSVDGLQYKQYIVKNDLDTKYAKEIQVKADELEPLVAYPNNVDNVKSVTEAEGIEIDQIYLGSCVGGNYSDLEMAAKILRGKKISPNVRLIVSPATRDIYIRACSHGIIRDLLEAGATMISTGCGACFGSHSGVLASGERCLSATTRNFKGRMGSAEAEVYLASSATLAASAIHGKITDPRSILGGKGY